MESKAYLPFLFIKFKKFQLSIFKLTLHPENTE